MYNIDYKLTPMPHYFVKGEILTNNNGSMYKVIDAKLQAEVLFERVSDGYRLIANLPKLYIKTYTDGRQEPVIEWAWSKGLGWET